MRKSKIIVLTGASRGIGLSVAKHLLAHASQHRLILVARSRSPLEELQDSYPSRVAILVGDLSDPTLGRTAIDLALSRFGGLDSVVVNHAGLEPVKTVARSTVDEWKRAYDVNFFSALSLTQVALPSLRKSNGILIYVSSTTSFKAYASLGAYGSTKAALNHLAMMVNEEEPNVVAIAIRPGEVDTALQRELREIHAYSGQMSAQDASRFLKLKAENQLLAPDAPGRLIADLALNAHRGLGGKLIHWHDYVVDTRTVQDSKQIALLESVERCKL